MKIAITGHRPNKLGNDYDLVSPLMLKIKQEIEIILEENYTKSTINSFTLITGMALGIDILFAKIAIEHRFPFIAAIPFKGQDKIWPQKSKDLYDELLKKAKEVVNVSGESRYKIEHMDLRNKWMVDNCDVLIAVWDGSSGGTANCVKYAQKMKKEIIYINPKDFK